MPKDYKVKLVFDGKKLCFVTTDTKKCVKCWKARSGKLDESGNTKTGKDEQKKKDEGPIPEGDYAVSVEELEKRFKKGGELKSGDEKKPWMDNPQAWGPIRVLIKPKAGTNTYGRDGMFIHGGKVFGSIGCIDLNCASRSFFDYWEGNYDEKGVKDNPIDLVVDYSGASMPADCAEGEASCTTDDFGAVVPPPGPGCGHAYAKIFSPRPGDVFTLGDDINIVGLGWGDGNLVDMLVEYRIIGMPMFTKLCAGFGMYPTETLRATLATSGLDSGRLELKLTACSRTEYTDSDSVWVSLRESERARVAAPKRKPSRSKR